MAQKADNARQVSAVNTSLQLIEELGERESATITQLAEELDLAKSTVHDHLSTLRRNDYVVQENREYRLSLKFLDIGTRVKPDQQITSAARPVLKRLTEKTKLATWLLVEENGYAIGVEREIGKEFRISAPRIGRHTHMHHQAGGKAILAHLPRSRVEEIIESRGLPESTDQTITDRNQLFEELEEIRETGVAFDWNEAIEGFGSVSAPILVNDTVEGSLSVAGPTTRIRENWTKKEIAELVRGSKRDIELNIMYPQRETR